MKRTQYPKWPRIVSTSKSFELSQEVKDKIENLLGTEYVQGVELWCFSYMLDKEAFAQYSITDGNAQLAKLNSLLLDVIGLLEDYNTVCHLLNVGDDMFKNDKPFNTPISKILVGEPGISTQPSSGAISNSTIPIKLMNDLKLIQSICSFNETRLSEKSSKRRNEGTKKWPERKLLHNLYQHCAMANGGPLTTKPNNLLEQLVAILEEPLDFGTKLPHLVRSVINERNKP